MQDTGRVLQYVRVAPVFSTRSITYLLGHVLYLILVLGVVEIWAPKGFIKGTADSRLPSVSYM